MTKISRRNWLAGASAIAAAALLHSRTGRADPAFPKRLIITLNGTHVSEKDFFPPAGPLSDLSAYPCLAPLQRHAKNLLVIKNIDTRACDFEPGLEEPGIGHNFVQQQLTGAVSGAVPGTDNRFAPGPGISVDQFIASQRFNGTPFRSIDGRFPLAYPADYSGQTAMSWLDKNSPVLNEMDVQKIFQRVFGAGLMGQLQRAEKKSVLDFAVRDLNSYMSRLGSADREKMQSHLANVRALENEMKVIGAACSPPTIPSSLVVPKQMNWLSPPPELAPQTAAAGVLSGFVKAFMDIAVAAIACDATRLVTYNFSGFADDKKSNFVGSDFVIPGGSDVSGWVHGAYDHGRDYAKLSPLVGWYGNVTLGYLMDRLAAIPEGNGTVLDNTAIIWLHSFGTMVHSAKGTPIVIGGGKNFLKTGQCIHAAPDPLNASAQAVSWARNGSSNTAWRTNNDFLTALCMAFDVPVKTFGNAAYNWKPLTEILA